MASSQVLLPNFESGKEYLLNDHYLHKLLFENWVDKVITQRWDNCEDNIPTMTLKGEKVLHSNARIIRRNPSHFQLLSLSIIAFSNALHANAF